MNWTEVCIHTTNEAHEAIANILNELGASGVVIEDSAELHMQRQSIFGEIFELNPADFPESGVNVKAYFANNEQLPSIMEEINQRILLLQEFGLDIGKSKLSFKEIDEENWATAWKQYYKTTRITENMVINPSWEQYEKKTADEVVINLDPGMAFGTGTHPTTVL